MSKQASNHYQIYGDNVQIMPNARKGVQIINIYSDRQRTKKESTGVCADSVQDRDCAPRKEGARTPLQEEPEAEEPEARPVSVGKTPLMGTSSSFRTMMLCVRRLHRCTSAHETAVVLQDIIDEGLLSVTPETLTSKTFLNRILELTPNVKTGNSLSNLRQHITELQYRRQAIKDKERRRNVTETEKTE